MKDTKAAPAPEEPEPPSEEPKPGDSLALFLDGQIHLGKLMEFVSSLAPQAELTASLEVERSKLQTALARIAALEAEVLLNSEKWDKHTAFLEAVAAFGDRYELPGPKHNRVLALIEKIPYNPQTVKMEVAELVNDYKAQRLDYEANKGKQSSTFHNGSTDAVARRKGIGIPS